MASVLKRRGRIQVRLDDRERTAILDIVERLQTHISRALATTPRAYEDEGKQAEYDRWVRPEIERGYEADLDVIRDALSAGESCWCSPRRRSSRGCAASTSCALPPALCWGSARTAGRPRRQTSSGLSRSSGC